MAKNIKKVSDKLAKVSDSFTVNVYDNGFMIEISGRNKAEDWTTAKILTSDIEELFTLIREISEMEKD